MYDRSGSLCPTRGFWFSSLLTLSLSLGSCGHQPTPTVAAQPGITAQNLAQADVRAAALPALVEAAASGEVTSSAQLRLFGRDGLYALLAAYDATPSSNTLRRGHLSTAIDAVARQKDARASRLYWHTDLEAAKQEAKATHKPILSLRLLGNLDEELSCANSRFFRTALYPNQEVSQLLRERFVLHWSSERPAPVVTIDFRDGRTLKRTVTGNSLHYVLDAGGRIVDAIPGLWGPQAFARVVQKAGEVAREVETLSDRQRKRRLVSYHEQALSELRASWTNGATAAGLAQLAFPPDAVAPARAGFPPAIVALDTAPAAKAVVERPIVREFIQPPPVDLREYAETVPWRMLAGTQAAGCKLDGNSLALFADKRPRSWSDASAPGRPLSPVELSELARGFEASMAEDTAKNTFLYSGVIHRWLLDAARGRGDGNFAPINKRIYAELFRTPAADPWLGLVPPATFSGLQDDGIGQ